MSTHKPSTKYAVSCESLIFVFNNSYFTFAGGGSDIIRLGCYIDSEWDRDLSGHSYSDASLTVDLCMARCRAQGLLYAAVQYGTECFCDTDYGKHGKALDSDCNMPCGGDSAQTCGAGNRNMVYLLSE